MRSGFPIGFWYFLHAGSCQWIVKVAQKLSQRPCTKVQGFAKND